MTNKRKAQLYAGLLEHVLFCEQDDEHILAEVLHQIGYTKRESAHVLKENGCDADTVRELLLELY